MCSEQILTVKSFGSAFFFFASDVFAMNCTYLFPGPPLFQSNRQHPHS
jgi:hypothetical protein